MKHTDAPVGRFTLFVFLAVSLLGCEQVSDVASGAGSATKNLASTISGNGSSKKDNKDSGGEAVADDETSESSESIQSASGTIGESEPDEEQEAGEDDASEDEPESFATGPRSGDFDLVFEQSYQSCDSCGIWFDSAELVIEHSEGRFSSRQSGSLLIKEAPYHQGRFKADIGAIPRSAEIRSAILYMHLNRDEGISNADFTSTLSAFGYIDGDLKYLREITAEYDIKGRGYSKANPVVPIDFTEYARQI
ncbi:hypothetical protein ACFL1S_02045 [Pseudomonadota bacterium]